MSFQWLILLCAICVTKAKQNDITGNHLTIHMVAHTHDDPGWLITVDEYYIQEVEWIFYTMIPVLKDNPTRKFTYVEMAYMHRWWEEISDKLKNKTKQLVKTAQLQMNLGGWCMNDEANPTAEAVIHQMTDGNQFILENFGVNGLPTVGWHVDPFGHSWVTGGLWAQGGFDAFAVHRIDYLDLLNRKNNKDLEFMWKGSNSLGEDGWIFFHILDSGYCSPSEIQFWGNPPNNPKAYISTDPLLPSYPPNQIQIAETFISDARNRASWFKHNQLLMPYGCDFAHQNAYQSMLSMDKLLNYVNSNKTYNVTMVYSSLTDYIKAVNNLNLTWNLEQPDFFPYRSALHTPWTGYFTSRPLLKLYTRSRANELRVAEQFYFYAKRLNLNVDYNMGMYNITFLRDAFDVLQHHDAITGTEKQAVSDEYMNQLSNGTERVGHWDESVVGYFLQKGNNIPKLKRGNDISQLTDNNVIVLVAYNSLAWTITEFLQIPSNRSDLTVYDSIGNIIPSQINQICYQEQNDKYPSKYNLFILAQNMKPLSFETFFIKINKSESIIGKIYTPKYINETLKAGNGYYTITIDVNTNRLYSITNNGIGESFKIENQLLQYVPNGEMYIFDGWKGSDPYIFRPATDNRILLQRENNNPKLYFTFPFRNKLLSNPNIGFLVQTHSTMSWGNTYINAYTPTICDINISNGSFNVQLFRSNSYNYNEDPVLDFFVFDNNNPLYGLIVDSQKTGTIKVTAPQGVSYKNVQIKFNGTISVKNPVVLVSVRSMNNCDGSHYAVTIASKSISGFNVWIRRVDKNETWNSFVYIDYIAYDSDNFNYSPTLIQGEVTITIPYGVSNTQQYNISYASYDNKYKNEYNDFIVNEPIILMGIHQLQPNINSNSDVGYYATTTFSTNWTHFMLNIFPYHKTNEIVELTISYIAFERKTLEAPVTQDFNIKNVLVSGPLMDEIQQTFKHGYSQTLRVFNVDDNDLKFIDNRIHIGPIDQAAELVTRFTTQFNTNNTFYTNQAGLEYVTRIYDPYTDERISGNYYPSAGATYIEDPSGVRFSTIMNQGHGVGFGGGNNIINGQYELMLQRRLTSERIDEILNTTCHTEPQIIIIMDNDENTVNFNRRYYQIQQFQHSFFFGITDSIKSWTNNYNTSWTAINPLQLYGLPPQIFLQQMRYIYSGHANNSDIVMQFQNMFEKNESNLAQNITIDISKILNPLILNVTSQTEMNLFGTIPLKDMNRLAWNVKDYNGNIKRIRDKHSEWKRKQLQVEKDKSPIINLLPRDIRTFVVNSVPISAII